MTYRQIGECAKRYAEQNRPTQNRMEYMLGQVVAMIANTGYRGFKKHRLTTEFMPSAWEAAEAAKLDNSPEARLQKLQETERFLDGMTELE